MVLNTGPELGKDQLNKDPRRQVWLIVFVLMIFITLSNLAWTFREPLLQDPEVSKFLTDIGAVDAPVLMPFRDLSRLQLVSRDMHRHPTRTGMLALSFTFVNRADKAQPYPDIEVTSKDSANNVLAMRKFLPVEYLPSIDSGTTKLARGVHVPVLLEFADPGKKATGFERNFR